MGMVAECEADLMRQRTREGLRIAAANGRLKGRPPKFSAAQEDLLRKLHGEGQHTIVQLAELFGVGRATVYRALGRAGNGRSA
ncbi:recombinase family protein [Curtobacterium flaccumfaciens]|uniref:recombinase family protein n=2 Tax=Curtobacterium flaccumfaciens TaxID=2035 RepID=UPI00126692F1|nr:helix-turn-helix domain-containing protein [Curtobacterium flaccumfaciens]MBT1667311.1 helix-turn-helix domain-containing protein [Curtobacterium flaccumfaciens pv. flaccumfaciens]QFS79487.1 helix-turn-helix domain-containing protein [Curtobacterium flaccumfaciens pv. flaccumfaciens]